MRGSIVAFIIIIITSTADLIVSGQQSCDICRDYGGFRDASANLLGGIPCHMAWFFGINARQNGLCNEFESNLAFNCCANPPVPTCNICGAGGSMPEPERVIPGTGLSCAGLQARVQGVLGDAEQCTISQGTFGRLCCEAEISPGYCRTCPDDNVLLLQAADTNQANNPTSVRRSCEDIALDQLLLSSNNPSNCPDLSSTGCCGTIPEASVCTGADLCGESNSFKPNTSIFTTKAFQDDNDLPTCQEFIDTFTLASINQEGSCAGLAGSDTGFIGVERGCCQGREQCKVCNEGGEVADPDRTLDFVAPGLTCGTVNAALGFLPPELCGAAFLDFDIHGYCGCPTAAPAPNVCVTNNSDNNNSSGMCRQRPTGGEGGGGGVADPSLTVAITTGGDIAAAKNEVTCGELYDIVPYLAFDDLCPPVVEWERQCGCAPAVIITDSNPTSMAPPVSLEADEATPTPSSGGGTSLFETAVPTATPANGDGGSSSSSASSTYSLPPTGAIITMAVTVWASVFG